MENCESQLKEREVMESQLNDPEVIAMLEDPFVSPIAVERAVIDAEIHSSLDMLRELWNPSRSAIQNLKSMMGLVQSYMMKQRKVDPTTRRMQEAKKIKETLIQVLRLQPKLCLLGPTCSKEKIINFLRAHKLYATFAEGVMTQDTYFEWLDDFEERSKSQPLSSDASVQSLPSSSDVSVQCMMEHTPEYVEMKSDGGGLDALFDLPTSSQKNNVLPQFIAKPENGRLLTLRSPGERGYRLIRLDMYDVRDIVNKDKRQWWKSAMVRGQFLTSSPVDRKQQLVIQLLDRAADDLRKVEGVRMDANNIAYQKE